MNNLRVWALALAVGIVASVALATAQGPVGQDLSLEPALPAERTGLWFVELRGRPTASGGALETTLAEKAAFRTAAAGAGLRFVERYAYDTLFNGLAIRIDPAQSGTLAGISGVRRVYPVVDMAITRPAGPPDRPELDLTQSISLIGAHVAQATLGLSGQGIRVGVIDSGIDYDHPDLGGCFGAGCRVAIGHDLVGDAYDASSHTEAGATPVPDALPDDCDGHGTHVAGIIGANGSMTGVAPHVTLGAYRVFGCGGSTSSDVVLAAMERALRDGMQVVHLGFGTRFLWPNYPVAAAATRLVNVGVTVVAAAGDAADEAGWVTSAPAVGAHVLSVASFDDARPLILQVTGPWSAPLDVSYYPALGLPAPPTGNTSPLARTGTAYAIDDACTRLPANSLVGKVALIKRGVCTFYDKARNAMEAGAVAVILYNNVGGYLLPHVGPPRPDATPVTIPVVMVTQADGQALDRFVEGDPGATMTWTDRVATNVPVPAARISRFSAQGLSPDLSLKPDIGAPGTNVRSTYPVELGHSAKSSGTAVASSHVAGAVALLLEARPGITAHAVRELLQNSAEPGLARDTLVFQAGISRQGAGHIRIDRALATTTRVQPSHLALEEGETGPAVRSLTIHNTGRSTQTYALASPGAQGVTFAVNGMPVSSVAVRAGGRVRVTVSIPPPPVTTHGEVYGGYLTMRSDSGQSVSVPYAGVVGDYQRIRVLTSTTAGLPRMARLGTSGVVLVDNDGQSFTMSGYDVPLLAVHVDHQSRQARIDVIDVGTGRSVGRVLQEDYLAPNSGPNRFFVFRFDGTARRGSRTSVVRNGSYVLRLSFLKALGDASNPAHWESWTSPVFVVARAGS